jgi:hypothetical protein
MLGKVVLSGHFENMENSLSVEQLANGMYVFELQNEYYTLIHKLQIHH